MRFRTLAVVLVVLMAPLAWRVVALQQAAEASLIIANGIVVTVDGSRRILNPSGANPKGHV